jgi:AcrR family transcriptional regulator
MGTAERREREKQKRREHILKTARKLFWKKGFPGSTMPDIAKAAELAPGTLYLYFPSKEAIYIELLAEGFGQLRDRLIGAVRPDDETPAQAAALIDAFIGYARECPEYFDIIFFVLQRGAGGPRDTLVETGQLRRLEEQETACKAVAAGVLSRIRPDLTPGELDLTVEAVWSMLVGVVFYFRREGNERFAAVADQARQLILRAVNR